MFKVLNNDQGNLFYWVGTCSSLCMYVRKRKTKSQLGSYMWPSQNRNRPADWMNECDLNSILLIKWDNIINIRLLVYTYHYYQHCFVIVYTTTIYLYTWTYLVHWVLNGIVLYTIIWLIFEYYWTSNFCWRVVGGTVQTLFFLLSPLCTVQTHFQEKENVAFVTWSNSNIKPIQKAILLSFW